MKCHFFRQNAISDNVAVICSVPARLTCVAATIVAFGLLPAIASASPFAYVPNEKSGTISIIDTVTDSVVGEVKAGTKPRGRVARKDGKALYVSDQPTNSLLIVDLATKAVVGSVVVGESPEGVGISPNGDWVVVASEITNAINFISTATNKQEFTISTCFNSCRKYIY